MQAVILDAPARITESERSAARFEDSENLILRRTGHMFAWLTSGYSPGMAGQDISLLEGGNFLPKPYSIGKLAQFVRECLDGKPKRN